MMHAVVFFVLCISTVVWTITFKTANPLRLSSRKTTATMIDELRQQQGEMREQLKKVTTMVENLKKGKETHLTKVKPEPVRQDDTEKDMKTSLNDLSSKLDRLRKDHDQIEQKVNDEMKGQLKKALSMVENLKKDKETHQSHFKSEAARKGIKTGAISFQTRQVEDSISLPNGAKIKFDDIQLNDGDHYNKSTGIFTAPVDGTYMFWASVMRGRRDVLRVVLMIDGKEAIRGYTGDKLTKGTAHLTDIARLTKGQKVWLKTAFPSGSQINGKRYSSYGGTLLYEN